MKLQASTTLELGEKTEISNVLSNLSGCEPRVGELGYSQGLCLNPLGVGRL